MDGRGGGCVARYSPGGGSFGEICYGPYGMSKVERIMLKYRPIAPKPMAAGSGSSCSTVEHSESPVKTRRRKRKYVRVNGNKKKKDMGTNSVSKKRKVSTSSGESSGVVTLSLMPETPDRKDNSSNSWQTSSPSETRDLVSPALNCKRQSPILLSFNKIGDSQVTASLSPPQSQKTVVTSFVTLECVTEAWVTSDRLGVTDQVQVMNMDMDTCPSFITNARDTVVWTNKAYREMTAGKGVDETTTVVVKKFNRVTMPLPAFTCKVKVTWGTERAASPLTVTAPCDVWRMRCGGYAWRLDVNAALSLGRYS